MPNKYVPDNISREEAFITHQVLNNVKKATLDGTPSGLVIDRAIDEALEAGTSLRHLG
ncbi:hypothetical protein [Corynebacterium stationis]|uniref:hypothetical protein n=1 Tax=Corynebacterium stationis TaxID=1705 RepID=UPI0028AD3E32|nr:hypothetical protein [Corynebacterium stationis]